MSQRSSLFNCITETLVRVHEIVKRASEPMEALMHERGRGMFYMCTNETRQTTEANVGVR